jgi:uncharacterized protein (DUF433 family)
MMLINHDRDILGGIPVFYGTRVPVQNLIDYLATGETIDAFLDDFPSVRREQVVQFLETIGALAAEQTDANPD